MLQIAKRQNRLLEDIREAQRRDDKSTGMVE